MPATIASVLEVRESSGRTIVEAIVDALRDKHMLLLIDNSEQVQAAARHIGEILRYCPKLKALVTSREAINLSGARTIRVPPFELPDSQRLPPVEELRQNEAVRLFLERAQAARDDFRLTPENAAAIVDICRRVDALPLAIELAAARTRTMDPARLLQALNQRFKVLTGGAEDLLDHQKSLRELIAWSYDLLDDAEKRLWRRLSIFVGGCTLEAAQQVCDVDDEFLIEVDVEPLVNKSLVALLEPGGRGADRLVAQGTEQPRLRMLDTLREYALEQLVASGERVLLQERCNRWFLSLAEQADGGFRGVASESWLRRVAVEQNNVRGVLESCLQTAEAAPTAARIASSLWFFWHQSGALSEGRSWLLQALDSVASGELSVIGKAHHGLSALERSRSELAEAARHAQHALAVYRQLDDSVGVASALIELGAVAEREQDNSKAARYLDEALALLRSVPGDSSSVKDRLAHALNARGVIHHLNDQLDEARSFYEESLAFGTELGDKNAIATATVNLGEIAATQGRLEEARDRYLSSLHLYGELDFKLAIAYSLEVLAGLETRLGEAEEGAVLFGAADALREEIAAPIESFNEERLNAEVQSTRMALGDRFDDAWNRGRRMTSEEAIRQVFGASTIS